jgi:hypothetical protein
MKDHTYTFGYQICISIPLLPGKNVAEVNLNGPGNLDLRGTFICYSILYSGNSYKSQILRKMRNGYIRIAVNSNILLHNIHLTALVGAGRDLFPPILFSGAKKNEIFIVWMESMTQEMIDCSSAKLVLTGTLIRDCTLIT